MLNISAIFLVLLSSLLNAAGALCIKHTTSRKELRDIWKHHYLWIGLVIYGVSVIFYALALRGGELSVLYPFVSTTYIWTTLFSLLYLAERMNGWKWSGLVGILLGVVLIGIGS